MILLQGILDGYLRPGSEHHRDDVAGMLYDQWLPSGTRFREGERVWTAFYIGEGRGGLESDDGQVLWAFKNGHVTLADTEQVAKWVLRLYCQGGNDLTIRNRSE